MKYDGAFYRGFEDELVKEALLPLVGAAVTAGRAIAGAGRLAGAAGTRKLVSAGSRAKSLKAVKYKAPPTAKPSVPASKGPAPLPKMGPAGTVPPAPKATGSTSVAKPNRSVRGDLKAAGGHALEAGKSMAPWMMMNKMQGGAKPKPSSTYV
jgi:hypothetical protein